MNRELLLLVDALAREKNVPKEIVFTALESALAVAARRLGECRFERLVQLVWHELSPVKANDIMFDP